jgi:ubiquinone/menaquinone biosynthesis C-methylase UbiE
VTEVERLRGAYAGYASDPRKQRSWDLANPGNRAIRAELLDALLRLIRPQLEGGHPILDLGCGTGWLLRALADASRPGPPALFGVDLLDDRVVACRTRVPEATVEAADARDLPWPSGHFHVAVMLSLLSSMPGLAARNAAIVEAERVLAPEGVLVVWDLRWPNPLNRRTEYVSRSLLRAEDRQVETRSLTLAPPLARRLGSTVTWSYPLLARLPALRSHRFATVRRRER